jgi:Tfp pilus assembly protein PilV
MAGSKVTLQLKVNASTILEVVIAMVMIILVFGMAMMIYTNVLRMSLSVKKLKAQAILQETLLKDGQANNNATQSFTIDDFRIEQEVTNYNNDSGLTDIHLTAYDGNGQKMAELQKVIIKNND